MLKAKFIIVLLFASLFLAACSGESVSDRGFASNAPDTANSAPMTSEQETSKADVSDDRSGSEAKKISENNVAQTQVSLDQDGQTPAEPEKPVTRKIIRNADLQLESDNPEEAQQKITTIAEGKGGYVVTSTQKSSNPRVGMRDTVTMTLRVPAEKFNETLDEIRKTGSRVITETVSGKDVTEEFIDMQARLKAKKALEEQFLEIMKRSNTVQDALNVQRQLAEVRGEIEVIEGKLRYLENQTSLSTINVTLQTPTAISGSSEGFFYRLKDSISTGLDGALSFILYFITFLIAILPFLILVVLPIFLLLRYFWRKTKKKIKTHDTQKIVKEEIKEE